MNLIGFELFTVRSLSILPNFSICMSIFENGKKLVSSIGKDLYHEPAFILPDKRLAATGRIHHISEDTARSFAPFQASPCSFTAPSCAQLEELQIELMLVNGKLIEPIERTVCLHFLKREHSYLKRIPFYLDPRSIERLNSSTVYLHLSSQLAKHW